MMKRHMILVVSACCLLTVIVGCNKKSRRPHEPSDSDGIPTVHEVLVVDVEEEILPPPAEPKPAAPEAPAAPKKKPAPKAASKAAPKPATKKVATAQPKKVNPLKAAFDKKEVLAVAEDTPRRPAPKKKAKPKPKDKSAAEDDDKAEDTDDPDVTAVQTALVAFAKSVETADAKAFKENITYSKADKPMVDIMWSLTREMNGLEKDMKKAYGQAGADALKKNQLTRMGMSPPSVGDLKDKMAVKVTGNKAKVTIPGQSQAMTMVKVDGQWKVQLFKPGQFQGPQGPMIAGIAKSVVGGIKNARKKIGKTGYTPKKIMAMVNASMMPGPAMIPANMKLPKGVKMPKRARK